MKKLISVLFLIIFPFLLIQAQNLVVTGKLLDKSNQAIIGGNVILLNPSDSSIIKGVTTDVDGNFKLEGVKSGEILIQFSFIGYENLYISNEIINHSLHLGKLVLKEKSIKLQEVTVSSSRIAVQQKGDTTQMDASSYKTNKDASAEDLVSKMPGITVQDGKVQAQGESVQKVLVDGRTYFGDDANAVLKNLAAEMIDKIQVFDKKSDQSLFSGFDDGKTAKTMNIITKPKYRNGIIGKAYGGYGTEDKWRGGLNLNFLKDKRRITILANTNNINEQNFSSEDILGVMGVSGGGHGHGSQGSAYRGRYGRQTSDFLVDQRSGITVTNSLGINYSNKWAKVDFSGSYFVNFSDNNSNNNLLRQYITSQNEGLSYAENRVNVSSNSNHRINFKIDWTIDSLNSILFQPKISFQKNDAHSSFNGENNQLSKIQSNTTSIFGSNLSGINFSTPLLYRHAFSLKGRTISVNATPEYNQNKGDNRLNSYSLFFGDSPSTDSINQFANLEVNGFNLSTNISYTEPIGDKSQLLFSYGTNYNNNTSNKETFNYSLSNNLTSLDSTFSNNFNSQYLAQTFGTNYQYSQEKWNVNSGISYQYAELKGEQLFPSEFKVDKAFNNILPFVRLNYKFSNSRSLRVFYRSWNNSPSVNQLQNVINNSNPFQLSTGNPELKQDWQNVFGFRYSSANIEKSKSFFGIAAATYTNDYIANSSFIASQDTLITPQVLLSKGSQLSKPTNLDGYYNIRSFNNYSLPLTKIKSVLNLNLGGIYSSTPSVINNKINTTANFNTGIGVTLSSNISENFDFTISSYTTYNNISNTLRAELNSVFYNQNSKLKIQIIPWKGLVLQTDLDHQYNSGLSQNFNQNYLLWNAAIGYKFLKDRQAELRLSVFDILKQNNSITRNTTETYYEDVRTNVLQQYFMLTFSYNLKYYSDAKQKE